MEKNKNLSGLTLMDEMDNIVLELYKKEYIRIERDPNDEMPAPRIFNPNNKYFLTLKGLWFMHTYSWTIDLTTIGDTDFGFI
jgi:hypothetical protein